MNTKSTRTEQLKNADLELWRQIKAAAALEGKTKTQFVEDILKERLKK